MKRNFSTIFAFICLFGYVLCIGAGSSQETGSAAYGDILRLHVVANSDSVSDQKMKLTVRDGIVGVLEPLLYNCEDISQALCISLENKSLLEKTANRILKENGSGMKAKAVIGKTHYPEKNYGGVVFPEGEYLSVRVLIGEGKGKNWWCVLFPRMKSSGVTESDELVLSKNLDKSKADTALKNHEKGSVKIFDCRVRLKMLDLFLKGR